MIEGWKAYVLPAVAAVLLAVFFAWRCSVGDHAPATAEDPGPAPEVPP